MSRHPTWTIAQCKEALARANASRDTQAVARWTRRLQDARTDELRAFRRANRKRRAA